MSTLLEKPIKVNRTMATNIELARGLEDPIRAKILKILYQNQLSAEEILEELKKGGLKKALTTVRHHLDVLKNCGLIEIVKIKETRGAVTKFYGTSTKLLEFNIPKNFDSEYSQIIKSTTSKMEKLLQNISKRTNSKTKNFKREDPSYNQYLILEIVNRAVTNVFEKNKLNNSN